ncbi:hypothetical protein K438DRAFT_2136549 [Mycena galopus ATCC 62051]|nr:hypothetical protein K438DRAFT_2136549 [Mycena galopus ATCC 62051]
MAPDFPDYWFPWSASLILDDVRPSTTELANILHALGGSGAECACAANLVATPAPPAHSALPSSLHLQSPHGKERHTTTGSDNGARERGVSPERAVAEEQSGDEACIIRTIERVGFPPAQRPPVLHERYPHPKGMKADINMEGDDAPPLHASSSLSACVTQHRSASPAPFVAPSSIHALHLFTSYVSASTSSSPLLPATASTSRLPHPNPKASSFTFTTTPTTKHQRLAGPGVPTPRPEAPTACWGSLIGAKHGQPQLAPEATSHIPRIGSTPHHALTTQDVSHSRGRGIGAYVLQVGALGRGEMYGSDGSAFGGGCTSKPYAVVEREDGWDVVPEREWATEDDVDVEVEVDVDMVDDVDADRSATHNRVREPQRRRERHETETEEAPSRGAVRRRGWTRERGPRMLPTLHWRWISMHSVMVSLRVKTQQRSPSMHAPPLPPPSFHSLLLPSVLASGAAAGPSPSTSFARLSLMSPQPNAGPQPGSRWVGARIMWRCWSTEIQQAFSGVGRRRDEVMPRRIHSSRSWVYIQSKVAEEQGSSPVCALRPDVAFVPLNLSWDPPS